MDNRYIAWPRVLPKGCETEIVIRGISDSIQFAPNNRYWVTFYSKVNRTEEMEFSVDSNSSGELKCTLSFASLGEYEIYIKSKKDADEILTSQTFFVIPNEFVDLRPYKGDLHIHTNASDGKESAIAMALEARRKGMDFISITDHDISSFRLIKEIEELGLKLLIIPGEEITIQNNGGHILSLGIECDISKLQNLALSKEEIVSITDNELKGVNLVSPLTKEQYAQAVWIVRKINEMGGLPIIAHPYWRTSKKYYPPRVLVHQMLNDNLCNVIELLGGSPSVEGNRLAIARYIEKALQGRRLAITGNSDAHDKNDLGLNTTIAFSKSLSCINILESIQSLKTVACDNNTGKETAIYGSFDLVEYAYFIHREFYPLHDELCSMEVEQALCMQSSGSIEFNTKLKKIQNKQHELYQKFWYEYVSENPCAMS